MISCRNSSAVSAVCLSAGKLPRMPRSSSPPKGGLVRMMSTRSRSPISRRGKRRLLPGSMLRVFQPVQQQVHLRQQVRQRLGLAAQDAVVSAGCCRSSTVWHCCLQMLVGFDQKAAGAAGRVEHRLAQARVDHLDHEADDRPRGVELARVAGRVAHLPEHRFVEVAEGVDFVADEVKWMPLTLLITSRSR